jgi:hypothetical protein
MYFIVCAFCLYINPLNAELIPICHLLALLGAHHILHISRVRVKDIIYKTKNGMESFKILISESESNKSFS